MLQVAFYGWWYWPTEVEAILLKVGLFGGK